METSTCPDISILSAFLDDEIEETRNGWISHHVQNCPVCADQIKRFQVADRLVGNPLAEPMTFSDHSRMRNCVSPEDMTAYFHDLLPVDKKQKIEEHLDGCDACLTEFRSLATATSQLERSKIKELPKGLRQRVEALWEKGQTEKQQVLRLVVRLAKDGLELVRGSLFPSSLEVQETFAPVGAYRTAERPSLLSGVLLKRSLSGFQVAVLLEWGGERRAGLRIKIEDDGLRPVAGSRVVLRRDGVLLYSERTSADGDVTISGLEAGTYQLGILLAKELYIDVEINKD